MWWGRRGSLAGQDCPVPSEDFNSVGAQGPQLDSKEAAVSSGSTLGLELGGRDGKPDPKVQDKGTVPKASESHHSCRLNKGPRSL